MLVLTADHTSSPLVAIALSLVWSVVAYFRGHRRWPHLLGFTALGLVSEALLQNFNLVAYSAEFKIPLWPDTELLLPPLWLMGLWYVLAIVALETPQFWLRMRSRAWISLAVGALGGLSSYAPGPSLGALTWPQGASLGLIGVAVVWAMACWVLVYRFPWSARQA